MKKLFTLIIVVLVYNTSYGQEIQRQKQNNKEKPERGEVIEKPVRESEQTKPTLEISEPEKLNTTESKPTETQRPVSGRKPITSFEDIISVSKPVVQNKENGVVNWTEQYIEASGFSVIDTERHSNIATAKAMAIRGAMVVAQRNLLEIIQGVHINSETTVSNLMTKNDVIVTKVDGVIRGAKQVGDAVEKDGMIWITVRVPLYESNGLAPAVFTEKPQFVPAIDNMDLRNLPEGFVLNFNGKEFDPALFPVIFGENGDVLLDLSKIYNPNDGKFPLIFSNTKEIFEDLNFAKGVETLNVIETIQGGGIKIDNESSNKINWEKIQKGIMVGGKIAKFILTII